MARRTNQTKGLTLPCPSCGELEATITLDLHNFTCTCDACGDSFTADVARDAMLRQLRRWEAVCELVGHAADLFGQVKAAEMADGVKAIQAEADGTAAA